MPVRPFIKSCNQIQFHSESHSPFSQQLDSTAVSLQPLSQHGEEQPEEHLHAPPSLHEHWFASHAQSLHVQSSPQHMHAVALEPLNVARANGVATTALSSANPANDLINIEFSLVNKWNSKCKNRWIPVNESKHRESLVVYYCLSQAKQFQDASPNMYANCNHLPIYSLLSNRPDRHSLIAVGLPRSFAEPWGNTHMMTDLGSLSWVWRTQATTPAPQVSARNCSIHSLESRLASLPHNTQFCSHYNNTLQRSQLATSLPLWPRQL